MCCYTGDSNLFRSFITGDHDEKNFKKVLLKFQFPRGQCTLTSKIVSYHSFISLNVAENTMKFQKGMAIEEEIKWEKKPLAPVIRLMKGVYKRFHLSNVCVPIRQL